MKKQAKKSTRGRRPNGEGRVREVRAVCYLLPSENPIVDAAARARGLSRSDLLRAGLVALGVQLATVQARQPPLCCPTPGAAEAAGLSPDMSAAVAEHFRGEARRQVVSVPVGRRPSRQ